MWLYMQDDTSCKYKQFVESTDQAVVNIFTNYCACELYRVSLDMIAVDDNHKQAISNDAFT